MFLDKKNEYYENNLTPKAICRLNEIFYQISNGVFSGVGTKVYNLYGETQATTNKAILKREKRS